MPTADPGKQAMEAKKKRQLMMLGMLASVLAVIALIQVVRHEPAPARASANAGGEADAAATPEQIVAAVDANWPMRIERDIFAWEQVFIVEQPQDEPEPTEPDPVDTGPDIATIERQAARNVHLQAVIHGDDPIAMINGEVHRRGDTVGGFTIRRIARRAIVIEKDGVPVEIEMER